MASIILGGITITGVSGIRVEKAGNIVSLPMPTKDSNETELFDMLGVLKVIGISGDFGESTIAATKAKVDALEGIVDGDQSVIAFSSDQTGTINVMVSSVNTTWDLPGFHCTYDIKLIQGTEVE